ncbi:uncharacterized protein LOC109828976 [Asparagus officinalis]|uniref:uncharacterized protein LOC109828976 n=1 Tax=Asparagus officinalis TaxID=4686 RepID=UPI00098E68B3|nr:uncharacterized protein LOC109828976 [Asparagus officinalis]
MKTRFQGDEKVHNAQLQTLRRDLEELEMKISESITDYFSRVALVCNNMSNLGEGLEDAKIVKKTLRTLPESWNFVCPGIEKEANYANIDGGETLLLMSHVEVTENFARGSAGELSYEEELALMAQAETNGVRSLELQGSEDLTE